MSARAEALLDVDAPGSDAEEFLLAERPRLVGGTLYLALVLLAALVGWSSLARVDVVVTAPGVVRPLGDVEPVHAGAAGTVSEVRVREGDLVQKDDVLLVLDPAPLRIELERLRGQLAAKRAEKETAQKILELDRKSHAAERLTREAEVEQAKIEVTTQEARHGWNASQADARLASAEAKLRSAQAHAEDLARKLELDEKRATAGVIEHTAQEETERGVASARLDADTAEKALAEARQAAKQAHDDETEAKLARGRLALKERELAELVASQEIKAAEATVRVAQLDSEAESLGRQCEKVELDIAKTRLKAPVSGVVTTLAVTTPGRQVALASTVAEIAPSGRDVVLEALVKNEDRGDLKVGMRAKLRLAAFNYQDYGATDGVVREIATDASAGDAEGKRSQDLAFKVRVSIPNLDVVSSKGKKGRIELGMAAQVDVVVDDEPVICLLVRDLKELLDLHAKH